MSRGVAVCALGMLGCVTAAPADGSDEQPSTCASYGPNTYSPFPAGARYPSAPVAAAPWRGPSMMYPDGDEAFAAYGPPMPAVVECSDERDLRPYLDVTDGCLSAASVGTYTRGLVQPTTDGYFRVVALGFEASDPVHPVKWTDAATSYRFFFRAPTGTAGNPGFKAFLRYRTEDDLYVASWRLDGVAQIQRKQCGAYTPLAILPSYGAPTPNTWHTIGFSAIGNRLQLTLDGHVAITATDGTFSWGTAGIRIDSLAGAYIDDWRVSAP